ncbi:YdbL family protein [soil metagenome]
MTHKLIAFTAAALAAASIATAAYAQRDPAYQAARSSGQVGEQPDGYLGIVGTPTAELRALVNHINIKRKSVYTAAAADNATVEQMAFTSGCNAILQTVPGEKYQTPAGNWETRTSAAPTRDPRCV